LIWVKGEIDTNTVAKVGELLERRKAWIATVVETVPWVESSPTWAGTLYIDSPGGNVAAAMTLGQMLRKARVGIYVGFEGEQCVSACVLTFAGAVERSFAEKIGIHRPYFDLPRSGRLGPDDVQASYAVLLQEIRSYLREMNVSDRLADDMLAIPPDKVRYLSDKELDAYGLSGTDPVEEETQVLMHAKALGLSRLEYMERKALEKTKCDLGTLQQKLRRKLTSSDQQTCWRNVMQFGDYRP
jgi:ATP-dependent protease ClpP protease subunit